MKNKLVLLISIILISLLLKEKYLLQEYKVISVVDGDTITVEMDNRIETIRLIGIDTPEVYIDNEYNPECYSLEASEKLEELLDGETIKLSSDKNVDNKDRYGRYLRYVYLDDILINSKLVEDGYAYVYNYSDFTKLSYFLNLENKAKINKAGLWSACK